MLSALLMFRRVAKAFRHAVREEEFLNVVLYLLVGIGILVEILRRLGIAFVEVRKQERAERDAAREGLAPT